MEFSNYSKTDSSQTMEIDFLVRKNNVTSRHNISPIEVKSTKNYTTVSLEKFRKRYSSALSTPYIIHTKDLKVEDGIVYMPLYMTGLL